jgi:acetyl esterase/lipase
MKKNLLLLAAVIFIQYSANAQCDGRYQDSAFAITIDSNVVYGSNIDLNNDTVSLTMDIYLPANDSLSQRPVVLFAHGGYFLPGFGDKEAADVVNLCKYYASLGYVCASYNYRLLTGTSGYSFGQAALVEAFMASQDSKAAIRFFKSDAANANLFKVDPTQIFSGGVSAGAFNAINDGYLTSDNEIDPIFLAEGIDTTKYGNVDGNSGSPGFSSSVKGVIDLCGAIAQVAWIQPNAVPYCGMHGTADSVVPFDYGNVYLPVAPTLPIIAVYGSEAIDSACRAIGVSSDFHAWIGAPHVPFDASVTYFDSVLMFVTPFLYAHLTCNGFTGVQNLPVTGKNIKVYPVPSAAEVTVAWNNASHESFDAEVIDFSGRIVKTYSGLSGNTLLINRGSLSNGIYFLKMQSGNDFRYGKIIFN